VNMQKIVVSLISGLFFLLCASQARAIVIRCTQTTNADGTMSSQLQIFPTNVSVDPRQRPAKAHRGNFLERLGEESASLEWQAGEYIDMTMFRPIGSIIVVVLILYLIFNGRFRDRPVDRPD